MSLGFAIDQVRGYHSFAGTALPIALVSASAYLERRRRVTVANLSVAYVVLAVVLDRLGSPETPEGFVVVYAAMAAAWIVGSWLRSTRAAEAERRRRVAEDTRTAERTRIARELHDVVTHHVTAMVVQSEAARYLTAAPDRLDETLTAVTDTGRRAVSDLRHLLDLLNPDHGTDAAVPSVGSCAPWWSRPGGPAADGVHRRGRTGEIGRQRGIRGLSGRSGGPDERAQVRSR